MQQEFGGDHILYSTKYRIEKKSGIMAEGQREARLSVRHPLGWGTQRVWVKHVWQAACRNCWQTSKHDTCSLSMKNIHIHTNPFFVCYLQYFSWIYTSPKSNLVKLRPDVFSIHISKQNSIPQNKISPQKAFHPTVAPLTFNLLSNVNS